MDRRPQREVSRDVDETPSHQGSQEEPDSDIASREAPTPLEAMTAGCDTRGRGPPRSDTFTNVCRPDGADHDGTAICVAVEGVET
jgi:hypothetical protein